MPEKITFVCSFQDCTEELGFRKHTCPLCGQNYCEKHFFPEDHNCQKLKEQCFPPETPEEKRIQDLEKN